VSEIAAQLVLGEGFSVSLQTGPHTRGLPASIRFEPLRDGAGAVTHFVSFHEVAMAPPPEAPPVPPAEPSLAPKPPVPREDRLTGLRHIELFHEIFRRDFAIAQREGRSLTIFVCDIDALGVYNDTFGRQAGDSVIRRVGRALWSGLRRASDLIARVEEGRFVGFSVGMSEDEALRLGQTLVTRVRDLHMHHPRSPVGRVVTVSVGVASVLPEPKTSPEHLLKLGQQALEHARALGRDRAAGPPEA
jgi:diguanylate cyclase (GGDEF)-like protein